MWKIINKWHRRFGIISALFVVLLVVTGLILNHTDLLKLDRIFVRNNLLLDLYNIHPSEEPYGFELDMNWISKVGERIYFDNNEIAEGATKLVGAVSVNETVIVAVDNRILLLNKGGKIIERLGSSEGVPSGMKAIGITDTNELAVRGSHGDYIVNTDTLNWHKEKTVNAYWSKPAPVPKSLYEQLLHMYRGKGLSLERVMLDLHSGRILGGWGVYLVDTAAFLFLLLAITGIWMWFKRD